MGATLLNPGNLLIGTKPEEDNKLEEKDKQKYGEYDILFSRFDVNRSYELDGEEMIEALNSYVQKHPEKEEQIKNMLKSIDITSSSKITMDEFRILMLSYVGEDIKDEEILIEIYKYFDKNLSGEIGVEELIHVFNRLGLNLSRKDAEELIADVDMDGAKDINFMEFCKIMLSK